MPPIPQRKLQQLEFLVGESRGVETLYPPQGEPIRFEAVCSATREYCERFLQIRFYADIPTMGTTTFTALMTYSTKKEAYEMWLFSSSTEEPLHQLGDFQGDKLVFVSEPWPMPWGLQRVRTTFTPLEDGTVEYTSELWEPDGYALFCSIVFGKQPAFA